MTYKLTVVDNTTTLSVTETPVLITEQVAGIQGPAGSTGTAATIAVGSTSTGAAGTNASVTNVGTSSAATFNFTIPRGNTGEKGDKGTDGTNGAAATIAVNSTSTGAAGTNATVTNVGTSSAASLNFVIPRGADGSNGSDGRGFTARGAYSSITAYVAYDVVFYNGSSWTCKTASTGNIPTNTTYWEYLATGFNFAGAYSSSTTYYLNDVVTNNGSSFVAIADNFSAQNPSTATLYWTRMASKGDTGNTGPAGATGSTIPTYWYSPSSNVSVNGGGNLTALTGYDPFGLSNGVTVANSKTYYVDYLLTGSVAQTSTSQSLRLTIAGDAVSNFNFITHQAGFIGTSSNGNWLSTNDFGAFINGTTANWQIGGTIAGTNTAYQFQIRISGILRTASTGSYFQPKLSLSAVSGSSMVINRESYASLFELGSSSTTSLGTWS